MRQRIPVTVLVGFLGSGKTTLLNRILSHADRRYAVIVNDFAELGIDSKLVRHRTEELVELSNGCICCTLRADLLEELRSLSELPTIDYILVESTGLGEPLPIAQTFYMSDLYERVRLDNIVTVLDAANFWRHYESEATDESGEETIALAPLLIDQLEFCNTIVLNKVDLAEPEALESLESLARQLNPKAPIVRTTYGQVPLCELLDTHRYDYEQGFAHPDWEEEWHKTGSEADEYGFHSFVYRTDALLRWEPFHQLLEQWHPSIVRCKGLVVFSDHDPVLLSQAGAHVTLEILERVDPLPETVEEEEVLEGEPFEGCFVNPVTRYGDQEELTTELVFIGQNMPEAAIRRALEACAN
ncbi:MAG: CobW family GTP-binding protein [Fimbriimonadales bacterium]